MRQRALLRIRLVRHQQKGRSFMGLAKTERELAAKGEGCLGKAADDEPVFILRAQDIFAPDLVREWADLAEECAPEKAREARALAALMEDCPTRKLPD